jgi:hypothetical protein
MSVRRIDGPHCWVIELSSEGDEWHFPTAESAAQYAADPDYTGPDPAQLPVPCWTAVCEGDDCGEAEDDEDGNTIHIPAYTRLHALASLRTLEDVDGRLLCGECAEPVKNPSRTGERSPVFTEEDLSRVFVATAMYAELAPNTYFDAETEAVLKIVHGLVIRAAGQTGTRSWTARVLPFAVQSPLPGMPRIPAAVVHGSAR